MGDRISFQFKNGDELSVAFFSHWDGKSILSMVKQYFKEFVRRRMVDNLGDERAFPFNALPLGRGEPNTMMLDFIVWFFKEMGRETVDSNYYLGKDDCDGDNSDNGNFIFDVPVELQEAGYLEDKKRV